MDRAGVRENVVGLRLGGYKKFCLSRDGVQVWHKWGKEGKIKGKLVSLGSHGKWLLK